MLLLGHAGRIDVQIAALLLLLHCRLNLWFSLGFGSLLLGRLREELVEECDGVAHEGLLLVSGYGGGPGRLLHGGGDELWRREELGDGLADALGDGVGVQRLLFEALGDVDCLLEGGLLARRHQAEVWGYAEGRARARLVLGGLGHQGLVRLWRLRRDLQVRGFPLAA